MSDIIILAVPVFSTLANAAFALRREVFVWEQKVPEEEELDSYDLTAIHYVAVAEGNVVATLRLIEQPEHMKIGRVAVHQAWRGKGVARKLIEKAMAEVKILLVKQISRFLGMEISVAKPISNCAAKAKISFGAIGL